MRSIPGTLARAFTAALFVILAGCGPTDGNTHDTNDCASGQQLCSGACVDVQSDEAHCGACGNACAAGQSCEAGQCQAPQPQCTTGQTLCGGGCVDLQTDSNHCGACGQVCPSGRCSAGQCQSVSACGDGAVGYPETCDDNNTTSGDGCSASCASEAGWSCQGAPSRCQWLEVEPNDTRETATAVPGLRSVVVRGGISSNIDVDVYRLTITAVTDLRLDTFDGSYTGSGAGTCKDMNTLLELFREDGTELATNDDSGTTLCSSLSPQINPEVMRLPVGTYYIRVSSISIATIPVYTLRVQLQALCGDGTREGTEQCDDGNTTAGDRCSATCRVEMTSEVESNDTVETAQIVSSLPSLIGSSISPGTDEDVFRFTLDARSDLEIETFDGSYTGENAESCEDIDTYLELLSADGTLLDSNDDSGSGSCSLLDPKRSSLLKGMAPGTYFVRVSSYGSAVLPAYSVSFQILAQCGDGAVTGSEECDGGAGCTATCERVPHCGDGYVDYPEACDDNNTADGDGCSSTCQLPGLQAEVEPNGNFAEAEARASSSPPVLITRSSTGIAGGFQDSQDVDVYTLQLEAAAIVRLETVQGSLNMCDLGLDTLLRLSDAQGTELGADNDGGNGFCSLLRMSLQAGTYYVTVEHLGPTEPVSYGLKVSFQE